QDVGGRTRADQVGGDAETVAEPTAAGGEVEGGDTVHAEVGGDGRGAVRGELEPARGAQQHHVDLRPVAAGVGQGSIARRHRDRPQRLVTADPTAVAHTGALVDPLVGRVEDLADLFVADDAPRPVGTDTEHRNIVATLVDCNAHHWRLTRPYTTQTDKSLSRLTLDQANSVPDPLARGSTDIPAPRPR